MKFDIILKNLDSFGSYYDENNKKMHLLQDASNINILIGANNSGKSRFIRNLLLISQYNIFEISNALVIINDINNYIESLSFSGYVSKQNNPYTSNYKSILDKGVINFKLFNLNQRISLSYVKGIVNHNIEVLNFLNYFDSQPLMKQFFIFNTKLSPVDNFKINDFLKLLNDILVKNIGGIKNIFIPTLRTAHSLFESKDNGHYSKISKDIFKQTISHTHKLKSTEAVEIFTGLDLYYQIVNARNDVKEKREAFEKFEEFLSTYFFHGKKVEIVAKFNIYDKHNGKDDSEIINVYINGESKDLHELGDGIQALFILMYKIYMCENESLIFIDEPEINLHPGMQRLFLEQITTNEFLKEKKLIYFISTHSNHFLDLTIEKENISIFLFNKVDKDKFVVKNVNHGDNSALQYLGVTNSSVFLANCSIWVEGISDRNYLKAFLKAYFRYVTDKFYPKEDIDFAFIEYAGSNIDHYNFDEEELKEKINAFSVNNKIFLISDYDGEYKNKKHLIYEAIAIANENFEYYTTKDYKEVENILPFKVWDKILIHFCDKRKVKTEEDIERVQKQISDSLKEKKEEIYKDDYIGKLLNEVKIDVSELNKIWDKAEGTLMNKAEVSYKVLELTEKGEITWEDFKENPKIVSIIESLYEFIQKSNYK
ncbi:AAA family ATPase [Chryseobacterium gwangjuense]|uniref:AAA family ATPase n=1 Tax=Chryseobacterium gwangjuense TaxID=1069980 RepID=UPI001E48BAC1|nr:AAA family ATPase [Chryseobacterium gwangjuense]MCE3074647.1 ATP-binding protein [Chryseobacterium gwangjuense]